MKRLSGIRAGVLGLSAILLLTFGPASAGAANSYKPYSIILCGGGQTGCTPSNPAVIAPGGTTSNPASLSVTFTNNNKAGSGIQLGSDNLTVPSTPAGFDVISTSVPTCPATYNNSAPPCVSLLNGGATVGFRNLNLPPGGTTTIILSALTPAPSATYCTTTSPCLWSDEAKQSNDFSGTGNDLNADATSSYATITGSAANCPKHQSCATSLGNGGTDTGAPGSISVNVSTSSGKTSVTQLESLNFGPPLDPSLCSGVSSPNFTYDNLSNGSDNGVDRTQRITINTTDFNGYVSEVCDQTARQFTQLVLSGDVPVGLAPANPTTFNGGTVYQGLLPDCGSAALQVDCTKLPGVLQRSTTGLTHTVVVAIPPGFDLRIGN